MSLARESIDELARLSINPVISSLLGDCIYDVRRDIALRDKEQALVESSIDGQIPVCLLIVSVNRLKYTLSQFDQALSCSYHLNHSIFHREVLLDVEARQLDNVLDNQLVNWSLIIFNGTSHAD